MKITFVASLISEKLVICYTVTGATVHVEELVRNRVFKSLTTIQKVVFNRLVVALQKLVTRDINNVLSTPEFVSRL